MSVGLPTGMGYQIFEVTDLPVPAGSDWSLDGHLLGTLDVPAGAPVLMSFYLEVEAPLADDDSLFLGEWRTVGNALSSNDYAAGLRAVDAPNVVSKLLNWANLPNLGISAPLDGASIARDTVRVVASTQQVGLFNAGPSANDVNVVLARAAFLFL